MKKALTIVLAIFFVFALVACEKKAEDPIEVSVGICIYQFNDNFMTLYRNELQKLFDEVSTDEEYYVVEVVDGKNDTTTQTEQIDDFLGRDFDILIVNLVQTSSAEAIVQKVDAAGKKCVFINREPEEAIMASSDNICYVGAKAQQSGVIQGEIIRDLRDHGDINGDGVVSYIFIFGEYGYAPSTVQSESLSATRSKNDIIGGPTLCCTESHSAEYALQVLIDAGLEVECLFADVGYWDNAKGYEITAEALTQFGDQIEVVFCDNDGMALGASEAIIAAGRTVGEDIYLVGINAIAEAIDLIAAGKMTGTVLNDHISQAGAAFGAAIRYYKGEANEKYYWIDYVAIT